MSIIQGDALHLPLTDESIDAVVCDPPYGLEFMGKEWDKFRTDDPGTNRHRGDRAGRQGTTGHTDTRWVGAGGRSIPANRVNYGGGKRPTTNRCNGCGKRDQFRNAHNCTASAVWQSEIINPDAAPPNSLAFQAWCEQWAREAYRVLKPGGHLLAAGSSRTFHRLACGIEDAGFELRDTITHHFGQGFPKSLDVGKAIDKRPGVGQHAEFAAALRTAMATAGYTNTFDVAEKITGRRTGAVANWQKYQFPEAKWWPALCAVLSMDDAKWGPVIAEAERKRTGVYASGLLTGDSGVGGGGKGGDITTPATDIAKQWDGWGTALKPATEFWTVARKPLGERTVAGNVQTWGTGAINVDGCRIGTSENLNGGTYSSGGNTSDLPGADRSAAAAGMFAEGGGRLPGEYVQPAGRWPTNCVLTHSPKCVEVGTRKVKSGGGVLGGSEYKDAGYEHGIKGTRLPFANYADPDGTETIPAYECAAGCPVAELDAQSGTLTSNGVVQPFTGKRKDAEVYGQYAQSFVAPVPTTSGGASRFFPTFRYQAKADSAERLRDGTTAHPTVKPLELMRWLVRLVTPPDGLVLDMFAGSGTTAEAALLEGFRCIAIERDTSYLPLIRHRLNRRLDPVTYLRDTHATEDTLFGDLA